MFFVIPILVQNLFAFFLPRFCRLTQSQNKILLYIRIFLKYRTT